MSEDIESRCKEIWNAVYVGDLKNGRPSLMETLRIHDTMHAQHKQEIGEIRALIKWAIMLVLGFIVAQLLTMLMRSGAAMPSQTNHQSVGVIAPADSADQSAFYSADDMAALTGVNRDTVYRRIKAGDPLYEGWSKDSGGRYLWPKQVVDSRVPVAARSGTKGHDDARAGGDG